MSYGNDLTSVLAVVGIVLVLVLIITQVAATWRARIVAQRDDDHYRELSQRYAELVLEHDELRRRVAGELTGVRESVVSMEQMMRELK
ncbi:hypothetical protein GCM10010112_05830 [Actinoplanes lobatus]|uniref:Secreted protein n=2 Tax=Actinoplanes TaxID=1865 RepID=A0A7W7ME71_9ACTN|nr:MULTISPECIES: hypothetical protein [Actinoplanes]MBB4747004.1 hypothetical protein [Actinoplanes lobatus]MBW6433304.1 hypothetical protein [Actinoplanes hulinensis]GGN55257.1 hypothetical protein GCM10010112_05830 [Actinoplanes lobatus]GIE45980.1 hypothetical protein Alo02nite_88780 [Actinoplanes lobatus]